MLIVIGYIITILCVLGGYVLSGGHVYALVQPFEFMIIAGAALGSFVVSNNINVIKSTIRSGFSIFKGGSYSKKFYEQLLLFFFLLTDKIRRDGVLAIEKDIETPKESELFTKYPLLCKEHKLVEFICDHLRLIVTGRVESHHLESLMDEDIETFEQEGLLPIHAISKMSDSMPAFGIVAAVMGVVITMQMLGAPPAELGEHIAKALVGTFLGVLIGYGFTGPVASVLENRLHAQLIILQSVKAVLLASIHNIAPSIAVEFGRKLLYSSERPTSAELEGMLRDAKSDKASASEGAA